MAGHTIAIVCAMGSVEETGEEEEKEEEKGFIHAVARQDHRSLKINGQRD